MVTTAEGYTKDTDARAYCYTYRNRFGEEGAPSFPSNTVDVIAGAAVVVSGLAPPDAEWGVVSICIYRAITQHETGREGGNDLATEWMRVGEVDVGVPFFVDSRDGAELTESVILENISPPPAGLRGITFISNSNCLAGFVGNKVYFSENGFYHDWPEKNVMALDDRVRAMRESGGNLFIATDGHPYLVKADPDCDGDGCRAAKRYETAYPMVPCCSSKSAVAIPGGMLYPSHNGLVALLGGEPTLMTWASFAPDDWQALHPDQLVGAFHDGNYFGFTDNTGILMEVPGMGFSGWEPDNLSTLSDRPIDVLTNRLGELFFLLADGIYKWNDGDTYRDYRWRSRLLDAEREVAFGAARVTLDGAARFRLFGDGRLVVDRVVVRSRGFRLPAQRRHRDYEVEIEGTAVVRDVSVATAFCEL